MHYCHVCREDCNCDFDPEWNYDYEGCTHCSVDYYTATIQKNGGNTMKFYNEIEQIPLHDSIVNVDGQGVIDPLGGFYIHCTLEETNSDTNPGTSQYCNADPAAATLLDEFRENMSVYIRDMRLKEVYDNQVAGTVVAVNAVTKGKSYVQWEQFNDDPKKNNRGEIWEFDRIPYSKAVKENRVIIQHPYDPDTNQPGRVMGTVGCDYFVDLNGHEYLFYGRSVKAKPGDEYIYYGELVKGKPIEICVARKNIDDWVSWDGNDFAEGGVNRNDHGLFVGYFPRLIQQSSNLFLLVQNRDWFELWRCNEFPGNWSFYWSGKAGSFIGPVYYPWIAGNWFYYCQNMSHVAGVHRFGLFRRRFEWQGENHA